VEWLDSPEKAKLDRSNPQVDTNYVVRFTALEYSTSLLCLVDGTDSPI
jgi:hypothetical protein